MTTFTTRKTVKIDAFDIYQDDPSQFDTPRNVQSRPLRSPDPPISLSHSDVYPPSPPVGQTYRSVYPTGPPVNQTYGAAALCLQRAA